MFSFLKSALIPSSHDDVLHMAAHIGLSFTIQTIFRGILMLFGLTSMEATVSAVLISLIIGIVYKEIIEKSGAQEAGVSMTRNSVGILLAIMSNLLLG